MGKWSINHQLEGGLTDTSVLVFTPDAGDPAKGTITFTPSDILWGNVGTTTTMPTMTIYGGTEVAGDKREFTILISGTILVCSLDPILGDDEGGSTGAEGGSWTATDG